MNRLQAAIAAALLCAMPASGFVVADSVKALFADRATVPVEGVWQITDGAVVAVVADRASEGDFRVVCLDSPDLRLSPGRQLGTAGMWGGDGKSYVMELYTDVTPAGTLKMKKKFEATVSGDGLMELKPRGRVRLNAWALYRFLFTVSVRKSDAPKSLKARRIYPNPAVSADFPVVL